MTTNIAIFRGFSLVAVILSVFPTATGATSSCVNATFTEARSLAELPAPVRSLLGADKPGLEGIADRAGKFNKTDALTPATADLPFRRFALGAVASNCVLVVVERGGIAYSIELLIFQLNGAVWSEQRRPFSTAVPASFDDLVSEFKPKD